MSRSTSSSVPPFSNPGPAGSAPAAALPTAEHARLAVDAVRQANWKRWGPYLAERQWGTVREDYSPDGACWDYFPHDQARSRTYRWGEDGLFGWCDRQCRICFAVALWNGKDPILKERLFGLSGPEGNHGEDVKELYYYQDNIPTHSYAKGLYKYPQAEFPYRQLVEANRGRDRHLPEYEITDTGVFDESRYFDVQVEYAKADQDDTCVRITVTNRGPEAAKIHVLPTVWFRNTWTWPDVYDAREGKPALHQGDPMGEEASVMLHHATLGEYVFETHSSGFDGEVLFTENETNKQRIFGVPSDTPYVKDAFHEYVIHGRKDAVNPMRTGTKAATVHVFEIPPGESRVVKCRLRPGGQRMSSPLGKSYDETFARVLKETDAFYDAVIHPDTTPQDRHIARMAYSGMLWNKQFYYYVVATWLDGDPKSPPPPASRLNGRNSDWRHVFIRDVLSMPDKWEYPWFAAWDSAFHTVPISQIDPTFAKDQLLLLLREWYMHPAGQIPAYEFQFGDVNPPVHAWACWRVYKETGRTDRAFLERAFQKLMINFTWWVNRKDVAGKHLFSGGFLGLDNIGVFDRSKPLPAGGQLVQADGTSWMAFYCLHMLSMALELAQQDPVYEDIASKFFEHFVAITHAINTLGGTGLWDESEGFYYDQLVFGSDVTPIKLRSLVGLVPVLAVSVLDDCVIDALPGFKKRMEWFLTNLPELGRHVTRTKDLGEQHDAATGRYLLAVVPLHRLTRILSYMLDEKEFLSPYGFRSLSRFHRDHPFTKFGPEYRVEYDPADSTTGMFGGNSNWRGPVWYPLNALLLQALERYSHFYGNGLMVPCPTGTGVVRNLHDVSRHVAARLVSLFRKDGDGRRPCNAQDARYATDPHFRDLLLFHEYFDGDNGRGLGASHQTGWTGLVANLIQDLAANERLLTVTELHEHSDLPDVQRRRKLVAGHHHAAAPHHAAVPQDAAAAGRAATAARDGQSGRGAQPRTAAPPPPRPASPPAKPVAGKAAAKPAAKGSPKTAVKTTGKSPEKGTGKDVAKGTPARPSAGARGGATRPTGSPPQSKPASKKNRR